MSEALCRNRSFARLCRIHLSFAVVNCVPSARADLMVARLQRRRLSLAMATISTAVRPLRSSIYGGVAAVPLVASTQHGSSEQRLHAWGYNGDSELGDGNVNSSNMRWRSATCPVHRHHRELQSQPGDPEWRPLMRGDRYRTTWRRAAPPTAIRQFRSITCPVASPPSRREQLTALAIQSGGVMFFGGTMSSRAATRRWRSPACPVASPPSRRFANLAIKMAACLPGVTGATDNWATSTATTASQQPRHQSSSVSSMSTSANGHRVRKPPDPGDQRQRRLCLGIQRPLANWATGLLLTAARQSGRMRGFAQHHRSRRKHSATRSRPTAACGRGVITSTGSWDSAIGHRPQLPAPVAPSPDAGSPPSMRTRGRPSGRHAHRAPSQRVFGSTGVTSDLAFAQAAGV